MTLVFGNSKGSALAAPATGQSISFNGISFYLDNSPTLGQPNDTVNACGTIRGNVKDENGLPIAGVTVYNYLTWDPSIAYTNNNGEFFFRCIASRTTLAFALQNYVSEDTTVQVWPESTQFISVVLKSAVVVPEILPPEVVTEFALADPFPNPFNPTTSFAYALRRETKVDLSVYDVNGKMIDNLYSGHQTVGHYRATWNAKMFPSGIYIIRLWTPYFTQSKKCLLVR